MKKLGSYFYFKIVIFIHNLCKYEIKLNEKFQAFDLLRVSLTPFTEKKSFKPVDPVLKLDEFKPVLASNSTQKVFYYCFFIMYI